MRDQVELERTQAAASSRSTEGRLGALGEALLANRPAQDRAEQMMLYGQFLGSWDGTVVVHDAESGRRESTCEVHFGWALAVREVQDVWIAMREERPSRIACTAPPFACTILEPISGISRGSTRSDRCSTE